MRKTKPPAPQLLYAVIRLYKELEIDFNGNTVKTKVDGIYGLLPVFETKEEADEHSGGKCEVIAITKPPSRRVAGL